jgi:hypothetical protein
MIGTSGTASETRLTTFFFDQILAPGAINPGPDVIDMIADGALASARVQIADDGRIR